MENRRSLGEIFQTSYKDYLLCKPKGIEIQTNVLSDACQ